MRTISKSRRHFYGTHKGHTIEIERERPPVESFGDLHFYIQVYSDGGWAYDGYSPAGVTTLAEAKREALYGACLKPRPLTPDGVGRAPRPHPAGSEQRSGPNTQASRLHLEGEK